MWSSMRWASPGSRSFWRRDARPPDRPHRVLPAALSLRSAGHAQSRGRGASPDDGWAGGLLDRHTVRPAPRVRTRGHGRLGRRTRLPGLHGIGGLPPGRGRVVGAPVRRRRRSGSELSACVGTKEFVASTAHYLRLRSPQRDTVLYPAVSYPTYAMGALLGRCRAVPVRERPGGGLDLSSIDAADIDRALMLWANSPSNPSGFLTGLDEVAGWGRQRGIPVFSDECYAEFTWQGPPSTVLATGVEGVVAVHSLSKRSNLAGVRAGFFAGDPDLVGFLADVRRHAGLMVPGPVQAGAVAAFDDDDHVVVQRARYEERLAFLGGTFDSIGLPTPMPAGGFYLWVPVPDAAAGFGMGVGRSPGARRRPAGESGRSLRPPTCPFRAGGRGPTHGTAGHWRPSACPPPGDGRAVTGWKGWTGDRSTVPPGVTSGQCQHSNPGSRRCGNAPATSAPPTPMHWPWSRKPSTSWTRERRGWPKSIPSPTRSSSTSGSNGPSCCSSACAPWRRSRWVRSSSPTNSR